VPEVGETVRDPPAVSEIEPRAWLMLLLAVVRGALVELIELLSVAGTEGVAPGSEVVVA